MLYPINNKKIYVLKKTIVSPQFMFDLEPKRMYPGNRLKKMFPLADEHRLMEFFEESTTHELKNCRIVEKQNPNI